MDYLLSKLSQQAKVEARESLRQLVSTLNGLAGLHSLNAVVCLSLLFILHYILFYVLSLCAVIR